MRETTMRVERSEVVAGDPARVWSLLSSPEVWSLWPGSAFMFAVPGTQALRCWLGPTRRGTGRVLFEVAAETPGAMVRLRTLPAGRQEYTLSVTPGRLRGTAKAAVKIKEIVPRQQEIGFEIRRRDDLTNWLAAIRAVIEGKAPWPGADMPEALRLACLVRPRLDHAESASASALINADPAAVWDAVESPETTRLLSRSPALYMGYVPGTPRGQAGEMQYFIREDGGKLTAQVVVVTEISWQRSARTLVVGPSQLEQSYLLTPESGTGPTRLELTYRWPAPKLTADAYIVRTQLADETRALVSGYKSVIETATGTA